MTVFGLVGGYWMNKTYRQRAAVRRFYALTADASPHRDKDLVTMGYRHQGRDEYYKPIVPKWLHPLRDLIGEEAFGEVTGVQLTDTRTTDDDLRHLASVPTVERIWLDNTGVTDDGLKLLRVCPELRFLTLNGTAITDRGVAELSCHHRRTRHPLAQQHQDHRRRSCRSVRDCRSSSISGFAAQRSQTRAIVDFKRRCQSARFKRTFRRIFKRLRIFIGEIAFPSMKVREPLATEPAIGPCKSSRPFRRHALEHGRAGGSDIPGLAPTGWYLPTRGGLKNASREGKLRFAPSRETMI